MSPERGTAIGSRFGVVGLDVGTAGRYLRFLIGIAMIARIWHQLGSSDPSVDLLGQVVLYSIVVLAAYTAAHHLLGERVLSRMNPWVGTAIILTPVLVVLAFNLGPPAFQLGLKLYVGASLIIASFMGYGGCEVVSIPSLLFGKRYTVYCPYNVIDVVEKAVVDKRMTRR